MDLKLPKLGEGADSGVVVTVFVKEGDTIARDQAVIELENEKAVASIPSTGAGIVTKVHVKAGDRISAGQRILTLASGTVSPTQANAQPVAESREERPTPVVESEVEERVEEAVDDESRTPVSAPVAAPSLRRMARDL